MPPPISGSRLNNYVLMIILKTTIMKKNYYIFFVLLFATISLPAQREKTKTVTVTGTYVASKYENRDFGEKQARLDAMKNALKEAGVPEIINTVSIVGIDNNSVDYKEISYEVGILELEGRIRNVKQINKNSEFLDNQLTKYSVTICGEVIVEEIEADPYFDFETSGFKNTYLSGEKMHFIIKPTKDCYIRIFYFGKTDFDNVQIYPMEDVFKDLPFKANVPVQFPPESPEFLYNTVFEYSMDISDKKDEDERGIILIVALKNERELVRKNKDRPLTMEEVFSWLSNIRNDQKRVALQVVHIRKR